MFSTNFVCKVSLLLCAFLFPLLCLAQPGFVDDAIDTPVDGGLVLLLAAGVGCGIKNVKNKQSKIK